MDKHTFTLNDFTMSKENGDDLTYGTDIYNNLVELYVSGSAEKFPEELTARVESVANELISDYEEKTGVALPLDSFELNVMLEVDMSDNRLDLHVCFEKNETLGDDYGECYITISPNDSDYQVIKDFYFMMLDEYLVRQVERIKSCIA